MIVSGTFVQTRGIDEAISAGSPKPPNQFFGTIILLLAIIVAPAQAIPIVTLTTAPGVANPPPDLTSTGLVPPQRAIADTAGLVLVADISNVLQATLNAQGFTNGNNWTLVQNAVPLPDNTTITITDYHLGLNPAGTKFGEWMDFMLDANPPAPNVPAGSNVSLHWLQILNEDQKYNGFGFPIAGQQGFWQLDNGDIVGGAAAGASTGPYYDSNAPPGKYSVPPTFHDFPSYYAGVGTYLDFIAIPTWDVFTPAAGGNPATESIDVASYGVSWGFHVVPEPSTLLLVGAGMLGLGGIASQRRRKAMA